MAVRLGLTAPETVRQQNTLLERAGLPTTMPADGPDAGPLLDAMRRDKKTRGGVSRFTLLLGPGQGVTDQIVPEDVIREALVACRASS